MCFLKEEQRTGYLSQEKAILFGVLNDFKKARHQHAVGTRVLLLLM